MFPRFWQLTFIICSRLSLPLVFKYMYMCCPVENILQILTQKLYFSDDDAIYDVIIQEPIWQWRHC